MQNEPTAGGSEKWMVLRTHKHYMDRAVDRWVRVSPVNALGDRRVMVWPGNGLGDRNMCLCVRSAYPSITVATIDALLWRMVAINRSSRPDLACDSIM